MCLDSHFQLGRRLWEIEVLRPAGREGREPDWPQLGVYSEQSNEVAGKRLPLWPPSPPSHSLFFFPLWKRMRIAETQKGAFFPFSLPPYCQLSTSLPATHLRFPASWWELQESRFESHGEKPPCSSWTWKAGRTSPKPTTAPCTWGTHNRTLRPRCDLVRNSLKRVPHANFYG